MSYYEILGVDRNCTLEDIKKSYKRLCLIYHPDVTGGDSDKFIEIKEAYDFLVKNHKQRDSSYDKMFSDMFKSMNKQKSIQKVMFVRASVEEALNGFERDLNIFFEIPCEKCSALTKSICKNCKGWGYKKENKKAKLGFNEITQQDQSFLYKKFYKDIDLCVKVRIEPPEGFKIKGKNTESIENISIFKAILGGEHEVSTLFGKQKIPLPEGKISDYTFILPEKGLFGGNHYIKLKVFLPKNLTNKQKNMLNKLVYEKNTDKKGEE